MDRGLGFGRRASFRRRGERRANESRCFSRVSVSAHKKNVGGRGEQEGFCTCTPPAKKSFGRALRASSVPPCAGIVSSQPHQILFVSCAS